MTNCRNLTAILIFIVLALKGQAQFVNSYTAENSPLPFNTVRCLEYSNQTLWIGTDYGWQNWKMKQTGPSIIQ